MRIGQGIDMHQFEEGRALILAGVEIPYHRGLKGHSDADVVFHSVTDAILGAAGLGDIGEHFPDTDPQWKGARSELFLTHAKQLVQQRGLSILNVDLTVIAEEPKLGQYKERMRESLSSVLCIELQCCNVKATRGEKMGAIGRGEGIACLSTVLLGERGKA